MMRNRPSQKKLWAVLSILFVMMVVVIGCQKEEPAEKEPKAEQKTPAPPPAGRDTVDKGVDSIKINEVAEGVFALAEVNLMEILEPKEQQRIGGQSSTCRSNPCEEVKTYPSFTSEKPLYGIVYFGRNYYTSEKGIPYCFAMDESKGTDQGYDTFFFDVNHNFDLTDDPAVKEDANSSVPKMERYEDEVLFAPLTVTLDSTEDSGVVTLVPRFLQYNASYRRVAFVKPSARRGKIRVGDKEYELMLNHGRVISSRYDHPMTMVVMKEAGIPSSMLCQQRSQDDLYYDLIPSTDGMQVTVKPYAGKLGILEGDGGSEEASKLVLESGLLIKEGRLFDLRRCPKDNDKIKLPVGDYHAYYLTCKKGDIQASVRSTSGYSPNDQDKKSMVTIREEKPYVFALTGNPQVVFQNPKENQKLTKGRSVRASAMVHIPEMGLQISGLYDLSQKTEVTMSDGSVRQRTTSLDPAMQIKNAAGKVVAEGKMPFG